MIRLVSPAETNNRSLPFRSSSYFSLPCSFSSPPFSPSSASSSSLFVAFVTLARESQRATYKSIMCMKNSPPRYEDCNCDRQSRFRLIIPMCRRTSILRLSCPFLCNLLNILLISCRIIHFLSPATFLFSRAIFNLRQMLGT